MRKRERARGWNLRRLVAQESGSDDKRMRLRYAGRCRMCGADLPTRTEAIYERATRTVRCVGHLDPSAQYDPAIDGGTPGASARQEFERRRRRREERLGARHPRLVGLMLALGEGPLDARIRELHRDLAAALPAAWSVSAPRDSAREWRTAS